MINLHERMLPTSAGVEPATSWSPVGRRIQMSHRGRQTLVRISNEQMMTTAPEIPFETKLRTRLQIESECERKLLEKPMFALPQTTIVRCKSRYALRMNRS